MVQRSAAMHQLSQFHLTVTVDQHSISSTFDRHYSSRIFTVSEPTRFQIHYICPSCIRHLNSLAWYSVRRPCTSCHSFTWQLLWTITASALRLTDTTAAELSQSLSQHVHRNITVVAVVSHIWTVWHGTAFGGHASVVTVWLDSYCRPSQHQ